MRQPIAILFIVLCSLQCLMGQQSKNETPDTLRQYFEFDDPLGLSYLFTYFPPLFIQHGIDLKDFIRSETFRAIRITCGDIRAVDAVYIRAMQMTNNNTAIALLLASIATFDHRLVGLKVPVFQLFFPLSNESLEQFNQRVNNLPARLYADTPPSLAGDRDKLQHFFGSAFLTFIFESCDGAERFGEFIEEGEDALIVGGVSDNRDLGADRQGQNFGGALLNDNHHLPSEFLKFQLASKNVSVVESSPCAGVW